MRYQMIRIAILAIVVTVPFGEGILSGQILGPARNETIAGGVAGAIIGGIVGNQNDETPEGIAIGAAVGAIAGNLTGNARQNAIAEEQAYRAAVQQRQFARQQAQQQAQLQAFQRAASVQDVVIMTQNGIGPDVIANHLQSFGVQQEIGVNEIITLHNGGVNESVISLMQQISSGQVAQVAHVQPVVKPAPVYVAPAVVHSKVVRPGPTIVVDRYKSVPRSYPSKVYRSGPPRHYNARRPPVNRSSAGIHFRF